MKRLIYPCLIIMLSLSFIGVCYKESPSFSFLEKGYVPDGQSRKEYVLDSLKNGLYGMSSHKDGSEEGITNENHIPMHLEGQFPGTSGWSKNFEYNVSDETGYMLENADEDYPFMQEGFKLDKMDMGLEYKYIGCGPIALYAQMDYMTKAFDLTPLHAGYQRLFPNENFMEKERIRMLNMIVQNTPVIPGEYVTDAINGFLDWLGIRDLIEWFGEETGLYTSKDLSEKLSLVGTSSLPGDLIYGAIQYLEMSNLREYFSFDGSSSIFGDEVSKMVIDIKNSIDDGMPVILGVGPNMGEEYSNHMMNIFGYQTWVYYGPNNDIQTHTMLMIRYNWGGNTIHYMDSPEFTIIFD